MGHTTYLRLKTYPIAAEDSVQLGDVLEGRSCRWTLLNSLQANCSFTLR